MIESIPHHPSAPARAALVARTARTARVAFVCALGAAAWPSMLAAQSRTPAAPAAPAQSVITVAGPEYRAGEWHRFLLGEEYRALWTAPVRVPVLDLAHYAGGLVPTQRGGGNQTVGLRLKGADGREYQFRSVDKVQTQTLAPAFQGTLISRVVQDQVAALHPAGALIAAPLMRAAGVLHVAPELFLMPDDVRLGEFRGEFAGRLGTLEVRPDEGGKGTPPFAGAVKVAGSESFLEHLGETATHQVDAPDYLTARLMDLYFDDWDRYEDQFRWARFDVGGVHRWRAIPRDRDYAFADYNGALIALARTKLPRAARFRDEYPKNIQWLIASAQDLDPRLLAPLERPAWDSVTAALQARLTDAVIENAVRHMPPEYYALDGERLTRTLIERRDRLPEVAARFYHAMADAPEIHATDESERAEVERLADGGVIVRIWAPSRGAAPYFERRFHPGETREVRLYLHGGDDQVLVRGASGPRGLRVRAIGGGGDDVLVDSGSVDARGVHTAFYDARGENRFTTRGGTLVDRRSYTEPAWSPGVNEPQRNSGGTGVRFVPYGSWSSNLGPVIGGGVGWTRFGFRQVPYESHGALLGMWAPFSGGVAADFLGDFRRANSGEHLLLHARASRLERFHFFGFGNDTRRSGPNALYRVPLERVTLDPLYLWPLGRTGAELGVGPVVRHTVPHPRAGSPLQLQGGIGSRAFGQVGARAVLELERRDNPFFPRHGVWASAGASLYPQAWDATGDFGELYLDATTYLSADWAPEPTLALRGGVRRAWGSFPPFDAAFLGGAHTLRGYTTERFAGDLALNASAELRAKIAPVNLLVVRGDLGALALTDAGRVYVDGDSPGGWHASAGGGLWFAFRGKQLVRSVSLTYAHGEHGSLNLFLGMPF